MESVVCSVINKIFFNFYCRETRFYFIKHEFFGESGDPLHGAAWRSVTHWRCGILRIMAVACILQKGAALRMWAAGFRAI